MESRKNPETIPSEKGEKKTWISAKTRENINGALVLGGIVAGVAGIGYAAHGCYKRFDESVHGDDRRHQQTYQELNERLQRTDCRYISINDEKLSAIDEKGEFHLSSDGRPLYHQRYDFLDHFREIDNIAGVHGTLKVAMATNDPDRGNWVSVDQHGNEVHLVSKAHCEGAEPFQNGFAVKEDDKVYVCEIAKSNPGPGEPPTFKSDCTDGKVQYHVKEDCAPAYKERFDSVTDFEDGKAVAVKNGKEFYIGEDGQPLFGGAQFDKAYPFHFSTARVKVGDKEFHIDLNGQAMYAARFDEVASFEGGFALVKEGEKYTAINMRGEPITADLFDKIEPFYLNTAIARADGRAYLLKTTGEVLGGYNSLERGDENTYAVSEDGRHYHVDLNNKPLYRGSYEDARPFKNGYAVVREGGWEYHINHSKQRIYYFKYKKASDFVTPEFFTIEDEGKTIPMGRDGLPVEGCK